MKQRHMSTAEFRQYVFEQQTEEDFVNWIVEYAGLHGWLVHHDRPARTKDGHWRTPIQGDAGFPDLVLARLDRPTHFWEAKAEHGRVMPDQKAWLIGIGAPRHEVMRPSCSGIWWPSGAGFTVGVVRPSMREEIEKELA